MDFEYRVGNLEFPVRLYAKILKEPGWRSEHGLFTNKESTEVEIEGSRQTFEMYGLTKVNQGEKQ